MKGDFDGLRYYQDATCPVAHAFFDRTVDANKLEQYKDSICKKFSIDTLLTSKQTHSVDIVTVGDTPFDGRALQGDGFFSPRHRHNPVLLGIKTADCVPLLLVSENNIAFVHAGWRGLAHGIVEKAIGLFGSAVTHAVIGPHATSANYEVGKEILNQFTRPPVTFPHQEIAKCYLGVSETITQRISTLYPECQVATLPFCTMHDNNFFSVRREGATTGRNLSVVAIG